MKTVRVECPIGKNAWMDGFIWDEDLTFGQVNERPTVIVCPGGGYVYLAPREGTPVALSFASKGLNAFVLNYSVGTDGTGFVQPDQLSWAIGYLREHAEEWNIDPEKIACIGFSAGGHVVTSTAIYGENKPNALILGYPALSFAIPGMENHPRMIEFMNMIFGEGYTKEDADKLNLVSKLTKETAKPLFLFNTCEDLLTTTSVELLGKYAELGVFYECHTFQFGPHGVSMANESSANGSANMYDLRVAEWFELCFKWLMHIFGEPVFNEKESRRLQF